MTCNNIYASSPERVRDRGKGGGGGIKGGKNSSGALVADFWVLVGEGQRFWNTSGTTLVGTAGSLGTLTLEQILFNGDVWWDASVSTSTNTARANQFTFYPGTNDTTLVDPTMEARLGTGNVPPYPGIGTLTFTRVDINADPSTGNFPVVSVIVSSTISPNIEALVPDLLIRSGIASGHPVLPNVHAVLDGLTSTPLTTGSGNLTAQSGNTMQELLSQSLVLVDGTQSNSTNPEDIDGSRVPTLRYAPNIPTAPEINEEFITALNSDQSPPSLVDIKKEPEEELSTVLDIRYAGINDDYETRSVRIHDVQAGLGKTDSLEVSAAFTNANQVYRVGSRIIAEASAAQFKYQYKRFCPAYGNIYISHVFPGPADQVPREFVVRPNSWGRSPNGIIEVEAIDYNGQASGSYVSVLNEDPVTTAPPSTQELCSPVIWFEGPRQVLVPPLSERTIHVIIPREDGPIAGPDPLFAVLYSLDGGTSLLPLSTGLSSNADKGSYSFPITGPPQPAESENEVDRLTVLTVTVQPGVTLQSTTEAAAIAGTENSAYIPGLGILRYTTATLIGPNIYELSDLIWNGLDTQEYEQVGSQPFNGDIYFLDTIITLDIPSNVAPGVNFELTSLTNDVNCGAQANSPTVWNGLSELPRPVRHITHSLIGNGDIRYSWSPGGSQAELGEGTFLTDANDPGSSNQYRIRVYNAADNLIRTETVTGTEFIYSVADQTADTLDQATAYIRVAQLNTGGDGLQPEYLWRYNTNSRELEQI